MSGKPTLGLYLHIPFCKQKCIYCDFYSLPRTENRMEPYVAALQKYLTAMSGKLSRYLVDTIYFGGGTPTYLGADRLSALLNSIRHLYNVADDAEITCEANPDSAGDVEELRILRRAGFNRISLGMQSADRTELKVVGRIHTPEQTVSAVAAARKAGFQNLSLDLIYGLPAQSMERWQSNLAAALQLEPEHLSCYGLKVEAGTPLFAMQENLDLPGDNLQAEMYLWAVEFLEKQGYRQYEISNFARSGKASRHNWKYWTLGEYVGFGPGAHSNLENCRWAWTRDLEACMRGAASGTPPLSEQTSITPAERAAEYLMLGLRTTRGIHPRTYECRFQRSFDGAFDFLEQCRQAGYAVFENEHWYLTPAGFLVSNPIIAGVLERT